MLTEFVSEDDPDIDQGYFTSVLDAAVEGATTWSELLDHARRILAFYLPRIDRTDPGPCRRVSQALNRLAFADLLTPADRREIQKAIGAAVRDSG